LEMLHTRLVKAGLVAPREEVVVPEKTVVRLGDHIDRYIQSRARLKPNTLRNYQTTRRLLVTHFGTNEPVEEIHAGRARDYLEWLAKKYATATVAREVKRARQFFEYAKDCKLIADNPFAKIRAGSQRNTSRKFFVSREKIDAVLAACPDNEWRLIVVLARYAGLRIPSELEELTWERIDWEHNRFTVVVKKKEHIDGHGTRTVPIFPEIRPYLEQAWAEAPSGGHVRRPAWPHGQRQPSHGPVQDPRPCERRPVAQALREPPSQPRDGTDAERACPRRARVAGQLQGGRRGPLPHGHRRRLRAGLERGRGTRCGSRPAGAVTRITNSGPNSGPVSAGQMQS